jgi:hypothetical protein
MPITDRTSWQLSREGALRSFESEFLFLPTPTNRVILKKRIDFLQDRLAEEKQDEIHRYFVGRGITLSLENLKGFVAVLQGVFIATGKVARWTSNLANNDIRRSLDVAKSLMTSPHLEIESLISSYVAQSTVHVPAFKILKALIKGNYDIYPYGMHPYVRNIFALIDGLPGSPLTGLRILRMLHDARSANEEEPYMPIEQVLSYFSAMGIDPAISTSWLKPMLEFGLCHSYDPTLTSIGDVKKIVITPSGVQHLLWAIGDTDYIQAMLEITPIHDEDAYGDLVDLRNSEKALWFNEIAFFVEYLITEDKKFCSIPSHPNSVSQTTLANNMQYTVDRLGRNLGLSLPGKIQAKAKMAQSKKWATSSKMRKRD